MSGRKDMTTSDNIYEESAVSLDLHELEVETFEIEDITDLQQNAAAGCTSTSSTSTCTSSTSTSSTSGTSRLSLPVAGAV